MGYDVTHLSQSFCSPSSLSTTTVCRFLVENDLPHLLTKIRCRGVHNPSDRLPALSNCDHHLAHARLTLADSLTSTEALTHNDYLNVLALQLRHRAATGSCSNIIYKCDVTCVRLPSSTIRRSRYDPSHNPSRSRHYEHHFGTVAMRESVSSHRNHIRSPFQQHVEDVKIL